MRPGFPTWVNLKICCIGPEVKLLPMSGGSGVHSCSNRWTQFTPNFTLHCETKEKEYIADLHNSWKAGHANVRPYISVTHLHNWGRGWVPIIVSLQHWTFFTDEWCFKDQVYYFIIDTKHNTQRAHVHSSMISDHSDAVSQLKILQAHFFFGMQGFQDLTLGKFWIMYFFTFIGVYSTKNISVIVSNHAIVFGSNKYASSRYQYQERTHCS